MSNIQLQVKFLPNVNKLTIASYINNDNAVSLQKIFLLLVNKKIGILGGGQLGRMLIQQGLNYGMQAYVLDRDETSPCSDICIAYTKGSIQSEEDVFEFGKNLDALIIEIEHVNVKALEQLEQLGKIVIPSSKALSIIKNKTLQKQFYKEKGIPTADFRLIPKKEELGQHIDFLPAFLKLNEFGYDGKGVMPVATERDFLNAFERPSVLEKHVDFEKEISVIVVRNTEGQMVAYPVVECVFNPVYNLVDYLISPARISDELQVKAQQIAMQVVAGLDSQGIFAVEMFLLQDNSILVNETAPRAHNSGHQTIEGNFSSQFDQQVRLLLGLPFGSTALKSMSLMINLVGESGYYGLAKYEGLEEVMQLEGIFLHLYDKAETRPGRKMGHITIVGEDYNHLIEKANFIRQHLKIKA